MRFICFIFGHNYVPINKRTRFDPYFIPKKRCKRCGEVQ